MGKKNGGGGRKEAASGEGAGKTTGSSGSFLSRRGPLVAAFLAALVGSAFLLMKVYDVKYVSVTLRDESVPLGSPMVQILREGSSEEDIVRDAVADESAARAALKEADILAQQRKAVVELKRQEAEALAAQLLPNGSALSAGRHLTRDGISLSLSPAGELSLRNASGDVLWTPTKVSRVGGNFFVRRLVKPTVGFFRRIFGRKGRKAEADFCKDCGLMLLESGRLVLKEGRRVLWRSPKPERGTKNFEAQVQKDAGLVVYGETADGNRMVVWQALNKQ